MRTLLWRFRVRQRFCCKTKESRSASERTCCPCTSRLCEKDVFVLAAKTAVVTCCAVAFLELRPGRLDTIAVGVELRPNGRISKATRVGAMCTRYTVRFHLDWADWTTITVGIVSTVPNSSRWKHTVPVFRRVSFPLVSDTFLTQSADWIAPLLGVPKLCQ